MIGFGTGLTRVHTEYAKEDASRFVFFARLVESDERPEVVKRSKAVERVPFKGHHPRHQHGVRPGSVDRGR
jgi:hypothetical protein